MAKDIVIHPSMEAVVKDQTKRVTIRRGLREYKPYDMIKVGSDSYGWYDVVVTTVTYTTLDLVHLDFIQADGFKTWGEMLEVMQSFYPDLELHEVVTVVEWEYV